MRAVRACTGGDFRQLAHSPPARAVVVTVLFLPPTLIAGFFGMKLKGLPFAESEAGF